jgi:Asp-tRNA(Asn)/Glu-tRNA(Gln) amidotransferase C subunit
MKYISLRIVISTHGADPKSEPISAVAKEVLTMTRQVGKKMTTRIIEIGVNRMNRRLVVLELTEEEYEELQVNRKELLKKKNYLNKIPVSGNEIDIEAWKEAFSIAKPYENDILNLFHFYEADKEVMRIS